MQCSFTVLCRIAIQIIANNTAFTNVYSVKFKTAECEMEKCMNVNAFKSQALSIKRLLPCIFKKYFESLNT